MNDADVTEKIFETLNADKPESRNVKFPQIKGLCRTCKYAMIIQREYEEYPMIRCNKIDQRVQLDITDCSGYVNNCELSLYDMTQMALLIDKAVPGGQYL
jgi:hypothetical protein